MLTSVNDVLGPRSVLRMCGTVNTSYPFSGVLDELPKDRADLLARSVNICEYPLPRRLFVPASGKHADDGAIAVSPCPHHDYLAHVGCHTRTVAELPSTARQRSVGVDAVLTTLNCAASILS